VCASGNGRLRCEEKGCLDFLEEWLKRNVFGNYTIQKNFFKKAIFREEAVVACELLWASGLRSTVLYAEGQ